jgi:predicted Zn-dependent protease
VGPLGSIDGAPGEPADGSPASPRLSPLVTLVDDARDPAGLPAAFDCAGWPKRRVALVSEGRPVGVVHDARTAQLAATEPTGHTAPPGWRFGSGPSPSHLIVAAGERDDAALLDRVDDGLLVERVDYVRVLQPRQGVVTGTTRDRTMRVRHGRIVGRVPQFRFTVALVDLFRAIEAVGSAREHGEAPFIDAVVAPAMVAGAFPIDAIARR